VELERLREAHALRVAHAGSEIDAMRSRDEEATAHAVRAAEAGVVGRCRLTQVDPRLTPG